MMNRFSRNLLALNLLCMHAAVWAALAADPRWADGTPIKGTEASGCSGLDAHACLDLSIAAMGGMQRLAKIERVELSELSHAALPEQSYRQQPFYTAYQRDEVVIDYAAGMTKDDSHMTWPENDLHQPASDQTLVASATKGVYRSKEGDRPCALSDLDGAKDLLLLSPEKLLLTASQASDLHYLPSEWLRSQPHAVLGFALGDRKIRLVLNADNHLPDALETTRRFRDFWYIWGDVEQRVYLDNWHLVQGVVYPTTRIEVRNGITVSSTQVLDASFNGPKVAGEFAMDEAVALKSAASKGWNRAFKAETKVELAPGIDLYPGAWNTTFIKQSDGVLVLEAPISSTYLEGVFAQVQKQYPHEPIKALISTSDSWPHIAGIRETVAKGVPIYVLDLNQPLLARLIRAPHAQEPDDLERVKRPANWKLVDRPVVVGEGANRALLYPLRGPSTERQYMVYFPTYKLLYASDTLAFNADHTLYDPQLMHEVVQAVRREKLEVTTVYAMHEGPTPYADVETQVDAAATPSI